MKYLTMMLLLMSACVHNEDAPTKPTTTVVDATPPVEEVTCPGTQMYGWPSVAAVTETDKQNYLIARARCQELYPQSPCLSKFLKTQENTYKAICGKPKNEQEETPENSPI